MSQKRNQPPKNSRHSKSGWAEGLIELPGFFIEANLDLPRYHPHTIWWLAYISRLLKGDTLNKMIENPPWPLPEDSIIISQLIKEMIDYQWLIPDWTNGSIDINPKVKEIYAKSGEIGLARYYLCFETIKGQWWMDGLRGTPMNLLAAQKYDIDFSKVQHSEPYKLKPDIPPEELLDQINIDLKLLTFMLHISKKEFEGLLPRAFLSSPFRIAGKKNLRFEMYGDPDRYGQKILPGDLVNLEHMLWIEAPEIFGKKPKRKKRLFKWVRSPVEKFAYTLEKFPDHLSLLSSGQYYRNLGQILIDQVKKRDQWIQWYRDSIDIIPIVGDADVFFSALGEIFEGITGLEAQESLGDIDKVKSPEIIVLCSSFLNIGNLHDNMGIVDELRYCSPTAKILIIYGHANDDLPETQHKDIDAYCNKIYSLEPSLKNRILMIPAKKRSHEKVVLSSDGHWMIMSWNPCSSNPDSTMFEAGVMGRNYHFALEILEVIKEIIEDAVDNELIKSLEDYYRSRLANIPQHNHILEKELYNNLTKATISFGTLLLAPTCTQFDYEKNLNAIRVGLVPFLQRGRVKLINEHLSREVLISQIRFTNQEIFLASDRISKGALDITIIQDILKPTIEGKRYFRILWGREWEEEKHINSEARHQIKEARFAIKNAKQYLGSQLKTSLNPMENHAKFALFDGCRGLITSENLLSYGGEKTQYESRELGVFVESLPVIRHIEGKAIYHRLPLLQADRTTSEMAYRPYEWIVAITYQYYSFDAYQGQLNYDHSELKYLESALHLEHTNPDIEYTSEFDRKLLKASWECYKFREKGNEKSLFPQIWRDAVKYYLLHPSSQQKWHPYLLPLDPQESAKFLISNDYLKELSTINLFKTGKPSIVKNTASVISLSSSPSDTTSQSQENSPIIEEIMQNMVKIRAGSFQMGDPKIREEGPVHQVTLTQPFFIGKYMVTQELWKKVMGELPSSPPKHRSPKFPILYVNYYHVMDFIKTLNSLPGGGGFDLPTDAQWEYACRAGSTGAYCFGSDKQKLNDYAWSKLNAKMQVHDVGLLKPNAWGLYDMHGLEFEGVKDGYRKYSSQPVVDPVGPLESSNGICRGGHWGRFPFPPKLKDHFFRCSVRYYPVPKDDISYRLSFRLIRKIA